MESQLIMYSRIKPGQLSPEEKKERERLLAKERSIRFRLNNPDKKYYCPEKAKKYREENGDKIKETMNNVYQDKKQERLEYARQQYQLNREKKLAAAKERYRQKKLAKEQEND